MDETPEPPNKIAPELRSAWRFSIVQQAAIYFTVFLMSDRVMIYSAVIAHALYWAGVGFIVFLRRSKPILLDLLFVRWSFPLLWLLTLVVLTQIAKASVH